MASQGNADVVRKFTAGLRAGDVSGCLDLLDEDIVFAEAKSLPFGGDYRGKSGFVQLLRNVSRDYLIELGEPEIGDGGAFVAVRVHGRAMSRATGRGLDMRVVDLYELRDGKITRVDVFYHDSQAMTDLCRDVVAAGSPSSDQQGGGS
ncbi:MAG TPA: nuclear transport factor 2 family protein [Amycolatopsis sp.]|nr:nuclear transport factor 2 family protein [Amycolatopsis sp.]